MTFVELLAAQLDPKTMNFCYDNHHLISPWAFSPVQVRLRNQILLRSYWKDYTPK